MRRLAAGLLVLSCAACGDAPAMPTSGTHVVVARVGATSITSDLFNARLSSALTAIGQAGGPSGDPAMAARVRNSVLRSLVVDTVIAQEAARQGVAATDTDVQREIDADTARAGGASQLQSQLAALGGSMLQLRDEVRSSLNEQKLEDLAAQQRADEVEQKLAAGSDLGALAAQYSDDTDSSAKGGDLGAVPVSQIQSGDAGYAKAVMALSPEGVTNPPVRVDKGYDVVQLLSSTSTARHLRHILVDAPRPYTVRERPTWFAQAVYSVLAQDCAAGEIHVYTSNAGPDPCAPLPPSPTPSGGASTPATATPGQ